jgi:hypothetical protein
VTMTSPFVVLKVTSNCGGAFAVSACGSSSREDDVDVFGPPPQAADAATTTVARQTRAIRRTRKG